MLPRAGLADAGEHPRPLRRVPRPHQWPHNARRRRPGRRADLFRPRHIGAHEKDDMRAAASSAAGRGRQTSASEILDYCATDIDALERLLPAMLPRIDLPRALLARPLHGRGRRHGIQRHADRRADAGAAPRTLDRHSGRADRGRSIATIGVFDGRTFKADRWAAAVSPGTASRGRGSKAAGSTSATTPSGRWRKAYPMVSPMRELRSALSELRLDRSRGRQRRPQPHDPVGVPLPHRAQPAEQLRNSSSGPACGCAA